MVDVGLFIRFNMLHADTWKYVLVLHFFEGNINLLGFIGYGFESTLHNDEFLCYDVAD